jgi:CheY-like chemotaxis protein
LTFSTIEVSDDNEYINKVMFSEMQKPMFEGEVLLCEDNVMNQQVICEHLARVGLKTVVAENGKIGVDHLINRLEKRIKLFDLIFLDMHMPVMDGFEAARKMQELIGDSIPIVAMTANIMSNDMDVYSVSGLKDCIGKPFTSQELWRCLMKYFKPVSMDETRKNAQVEADVEFHRSLQQYFYNKNKDKAKEIAKAVDEGDIKLAHRLAHTLKGNAGQLGKTILQEAAADVEKNLKNEVIRVTKEQLKTLENELAMVINEFSLLNFSKRQPSDKEIPAVEHEKILKLFEKLEPLLKSGNPESLNIADELRTIPGSGLVIQYIEDFDFSHALSAFYELKGRMDIK